MGNLVVINCPQCNCKFRTQPIIIDGIFQSSITGKGEKPTPLAVGVSEQEKQKNVELNSLREFMFSLDKEVEYKNIEVNIDKLKEINGVIIGGHEKWQQKMKEYLPKFIFIHTDMLNFDVTALNGVKDVFFYINYLNHAIYYKVIEYIKNKDVKIHYINVQNEDLVLKNIYNVYYN